MTKNQAIKLANRLAKKKKRSYYVVYDVTYEECFGINNAYAVCKEEELYTYYHTEQPVYAAEAEV